MSTTHDTTTETKQQRQSPFMDTSKLRFFRTLDERMRLTIEGERSVLEPQISQCFPYSETGRYFCIKDGAGEEVGLIERTRHLDPESRRVFEDEIERRVRIPVIVALNSLRYDGITLTWDVETDRGPVTFEVRDLRRNTHRITVNHLIITDVNGRRYEIPDKRTFSPRQLLLLNRAW